MIELNIIQPGSYHEEVIHYFPQDQADQDTDQQSPMDHHSTHDEDEVADTAPSSSVSARHAMWDFTESAFEEELEASLALDDAAVDDCEAAVTNSLPPLAPVVVLPVSTEWLSDNED